METTTGGARFLHWNVWDFLVCIVCMAYAKIFPTCIEGKLQNYTQFVACNVLGPAQTTPNASQVTRAESPHHNNLIFPSAITIPAVSSHTRKMALALTNNFLQIKRLSPPLLPIKKVKKKKKSVQIMYTCLWFFFALIFWILWL